jgi:hypothetical protein
VDINGNHRSDAGHDEKQHPTTAHFGGGNGAAVAAAAAAAQKRQADLLFPYLEWWALAHARFIVVRRGELLKAAGSTYSGTAHLYGGWALQ